MAEQTLAEYSIGDSLSDLAIYWQADDNTYRDFSSGWSFEVKVGDANGVTFTKTAGITGAAGGPTVPSIVVAWATTDELTTIATPGNYYVQIRATRTGDAKKLTKRGTLRMAATS